MVSSQFLKESEVIHMLEEGLLQLLVLSLMINIVLSIISFILTVVIAKVTYKKNHISADR